VAEADSAVVMVMVIIEAMEVKAVVANLAVVTRMMMNKVVVVKGTMVKAVVEMMELLGQGRPLFASKWICRVWYVRPRLDLQTVGQPSYGHTKFSLMVFGTVGRVRRLDVKTICTSVAAAMAPFRL
jgi:hypothetical protein